MTIYRKKRLSPEAVAGLKQDIADNFLTWTDIAKRWGCSLGAVQYYGGSKGLHQKAPPVVRREHIPARPHMMPWATMEMLTQGRARPARVTP